MSAPKNAPTGLFAQDEQWFERIANDAFRIAVWTVQMLLALYIVILGLQLGFGVKAGAPSIFLMAVLFTSGLAVLVACLLTAAAAVFMTKTGLAGRLGRHSQHNESGAGRNGGGSF